MGKSIIKRILNDFIANGTLNFSSLYDNNGTQVLEHSNYPEYLIKISNKEFEISNIQIKIFAMISKKISNVSKIYYNQIYEENGSIKTLEIIDKLSGIQKSEYSQNEIRQVIISTKEVSRVLNDGTVSIHSSLPNLKDLFYGIVANTADISLKTIAKEIMDNPAFENYINTSNQEIIIADMVTDNILIDNLAVNFIDLDPLIIGPKNLQIAMLLTSNILLQKQIFASLSITEIEKYYKIWGKNKITTVDLIALSCFPLLILAMKQVEFTKISVNVDSLHYKLKKILLFIIEQLKE